MALLFVYGTLRAGGCNAHLLDAWGAKRLIGGFRTVLPYPMIVLHGRLRCLVDQPGQGYVVQGELVEVPASALPRLDAFEGTGDEDGYQRLFVDVQGDLALGHAHVLQAMTYGRTRTAMW